MHAPTTNPTKAPAPVLTPEQQQAQATIDANDYKAMLASCLPTLRAELYAAEFMQAELTRSRDVQLRKRKFLKAAGRITGGLPPFTDAALTVIRMSPKA
jgi:hypothetical protein